MTEYTAVTDWATIATGQKVRATRDGERVEFTVARIDTFDRVTYINNDMAGIQLNSEDHPAWTFEAEKVRVVLPTGDDIFKDAHGAFWELSGGKWRSAGNDEAYALWEAELLISLPLTRLRPEAEVAAEVIAEVHGLFGPGALLHAEVDRIAAKWATS